MLKFMRDSFKHLKWVLLAVVAAFVFGFVFIDMGLGGAMGGRADDDTPYAARVNGETISVPDYYRALQNYENMYRQMYGDQFSPQLMEQMGIPKQALQSLIDERLLAQEAERLNLTASPEEVRRKLMEVPTFTENGKFVGMELYNRYVTGRLGYPNAAAFEADIARGIILEKMESALMNSIVVSPKLAETEYKRTNENAQIKYVVLPALQQAATVAVAAPEVEAYYRNNQSKYTHGEQRTLKYLLADYTKLRSMMNPTDADLRKLYEQNKAQFQTPEGAHVLHILVKVDPQAPPAVDAAARAKAQGIVAQLRGGADFAALARTNSDDPSSAPQGGDMQWVDRGATVEAFERAIFSIPLNTISDPIRSAEFGYHIVKVTERRPAGTRSFEEVRPELAMRAGNDMSREQAREEINRVALAFKNKKPNTPVEFGAQANAKITSNDSGWFARTEQIPGLGFNQPLVDWAFAAKKGDISNPIGTSRGPVIVYVADVRPPAVTPLAEIRQKVEQHVREEKARTASKNTLTQMMAGATTVEQVAAKFNGQVRTTSVSRQGTVAGLSGDLTALVDGALSAQVGALVGPVTLQDGAVAFQVTEQKRVTPADLAQNRATYMDTLRDQQARSLRQVLVTRLRKGAKIEVNPEVAQPVQQAGI